MQSYSQVAREIDLRSSPRPALAAIVFLSVLVASFPSLVADDKQLQVGLITMAFSLAAWAIVSRWPEAGRPLAVAVIVGSLDLIILWMLPQGAWALTVVPVVVGAAIYGLAGGAAVAVVQSLFAIAILQPFGLNGAPDMLAVCIWAVVGALVLLYYPLDEFARWSWTHYRRAQTLLDDARDRQVELKQVLADLADANVQLDRLNRLAQGLRERAEDARRAKEQFVANLSHELRTPLNMVIGFSQVILRNPKAYGRSLPPALLADLNVILRNSQHLSSLIDDVLDLSQIEAGRMALAKQRVQIGRLVEAATTAIRPLYQSKGLDLHVSVAGDIPLVFCDDVRMREVLLNLLSNAGRFTEQGGVRVDVRRDGDTVLFSVSDTGPGIADDQKERIFQPFEQLDGSIRRTHGGSGLGLSISKAFVELHGGQMWFDSRIGQGTTFFIRLPIDPPPADMPGAATRWIQPEWEFRQRTRASRAPKVTPHAHFLIQESENALQALVKRYIDDATTAHVADLEEARREFEKSSAQALLVNTPAVGATLQQIADARTLPLGLPVIVCSIPTVRDAAAALGVFDYLMKPVSQEDLVAAVQRLNVAGGTILVIDDEPDAQQLFHRMLTAAPHTYNVLRAAGGRDGLAILRSQHVDAILLDMVMPEMDGFQFLAALSRDEQISHTPVIAVTGRDPAGHAVVSRSLGVTTAEGLSAVQLLAAIQDITHNLSAVSMPDRAQPTDRPA